MAKIVYEVVTVRFSKIVKDEASEGATMVTKEIEDAIEMMAEQLCGDSVVVEVSGPNNGAAA